MLPVIEITEVQVSQKPMLIYIAAHQLLLETVTVQESLPDIDGFMGSLIDWILRRHKPAFFQPALQHIEFRVRQTWKSVRHPP